MGALGPVIRPTTLMRISENDYLVVHDDILDVVPKAGDAARSDGRRMRLALVDGPRRGVLKDRSQRGVDGIEKSYAEPSTHVFEIHRGLAKLSGCSGMLPPRAIHARRAAISARSCAS